MQPAGKGTPVGFLERDLILGAPEINCKPDEISGDVTRERQGARENERKGSFTKLMVVLL